jgi:Mn2+/Fe2+ NRAMP family transporter
MSEDFRKLGGLSAGKRLRVWVSLHPLGGAVLAGIVAGQLATVWGSWFSGVGLPNLDWPLANGFVIYPTGSVIQQWVIGLWIHEIDCVVFAIIFAFFIFPVMGKVVSSIMNMSKAIIFSFVLATISAGFLVPYVYYPAYHMGVFGENWKTIFAIYLWHLIYGANLGAFYNPLPADDPLLQAA